MSCLDTCLPFWRLGRGPRQIRRNPRDWMSWIWWHGQAWPPAHVPGAKLKSLHFANSKINLLQLKIRSPSCTLIRLISWPKSKSQTLDSCALFVNPSAKFRQGIDQSRDLRKKFWSIKIPTTACSKMPSWSCPWPWFICRGGQSSLHLPRSWSAYLDQETTRPWAVSLHAPVRRSWMRNLKESKISNRIH